jgi:hypothetical protein
VPKVESSIEIMQNEPNLLRLICLKGIVTYLKVPKKHANGAILHQTFHSILKLFTRQMQLFVTFCKFLKVMHLTPCTSKAYKTFHPRIRFKRGIYPPFVWWEKMQNEPNFIFNHRTTRDERRIMQNKPNFTKLMYLKVPTTEIRFTLHSSRITKNAKQTQFAAKRT